MIYYGDGTFSLLSKWWTQLHEAGGDASLFLKARGIKNIAVYGRGVWTEQLFRDLQYSEIDIQDITDLAFDSEQPPSVDIIIVTETEKYMDVECKLCERNMTEVISIQELIDKTLRNIERN